MKLHNSKRARFAKRPKNGVTSSTKKTHKTKKNNYAACNRGDHRLLLMCCMYEMRSHSQVDSTGMRL